MFGHVDEAKPHTVIEVTQPWRFPTLRRAVVTPGVYKIQGDVRDRFGHTRERRAMAAGIFKLTFQAEGSRNSVRADTIPLAEIATETVPLTDVTEKTTGDIVTVPALSMDTLPDQINAPHHETRAETDLSESAPQAPTDISQLETDRLEKNPGTAPEETDALGGREEARNEQRIDPASDRGDPADVTEDPEPAAAGPEAAVPGEGSGDQGQAGVAAEAGADVANRADPAIEESTRIIAGSPKKRARGFTF